MEMTVTLAGLVLSLQTGLVSPQMHCKFDDLCDTLKPSSGNRFPKPRLVLERTKMLAEQSLLIEI